MNILKHDLGDCVVSASDVSVPAVNYMARFSPNALFNQAYFLQEAGIGLHFPSRVVMSIVHDNNVLEIDENDVHTYASYTGSASNCQGYDAIITCAKGVPLMGFWADCAELMVAGKEHVGMVHAGRLTLDKKILHVFFDRFFMKELPSVTKVAISPYLGVDNHSFYPDSCDRFSEWMSNGCVDERRGESYLDMGEVLRQDLRSVGVLEKNIDDPRIDSFSLSIKSQYKEGFRVSHRHAAKFEGRAEGRGISVVMLKPDLDPTGTIVDEK